MSSSPAGTSLEPSSRRPSPPSTAEPDEPDRSTRPDAPKTRRLAADGRRWALLAALVYLALAFLLFREAWGAASTHNIGSGGDPPYAMWALTWTPEALAQGWNPLFTDHLNHPDGVNMMWNALLPLHALLLWPVTASAGPVVAYNLLVTVNVAASAWCGFLALRRFVPNQAAAFAGGLVYGFSPYMIAQSLDHPTLTAAYIPPLLLLVLHEILVRQRRSAVRTGFVLGGLAAMQLFIAEEMLACQALIAGLGLLLLVCLYPRSVAGRARHAVVALGSALGLFLLTTSWALWFQFFGPQRLTGGTVQPSNFFVSDLANFVVPTEVQQVSPGWAEEMSRRWSGNPSEWDAYLGAPLLAVAVFVVARFWSEPLVRVVGLLALATAVLSLGPNLHVNGDDTGFPLPWRAVEWVPLVGHILPTRLMLFVFLMVAVLVAVLVQHLLTHPPRARGVLRLLGGVAVVTLFLPTLSYPSHRIAVPTFFTDGSARIVPEGTVALVAPFQQLYPAEPMLWQAATGMRFRMPQGYFFAPDNDGKPRYGAPASAMSAAMLAVQSGNQPDLTPELRLAIAQDLAVRDVQTVIVGPMERQQDMVRLFEELFDAPPDQFDDVYVWQRAHRLLRQAR